ncbi:DUF2726 domain-containing protein [Duganella sp. P38]|uniref:DUF2726 domain-containing protein n=1 Tax=Duganella sp. P38 TaxID=3423949 RepID=UPI003D79E646
MPFPDADIIFQTMLAEAFKYAPPIFIAAAVFAFINARLNRYFKSARRRRPRSPPMSFPKLNTPAPLAELKLTARRPLTAREEQMYLLLTEALPECTVLSQVSFQSLLDTPVFADRNRFDRKYADFVICSRRLTPIAIIELDDDSHALRGRQDADRDAMLRNAGYSTLRYRDIPPASQVQADIEAVLRALTSA